MAPIPLRARNKDLEVQCQFSAPIHATLGVPCPFSRRNKASEAKPVLLWQGALTHSAFNNHELLNHLRKNRAPVSLPWILHNGNFETLVGFVLEGFLLMQNQNTQKINKKTKQDIYSASIAE
jgi:hypothetical protein